MHSRHEVGVSGGWAEDKAFLAGSLDTVGDVPTSGRMQLNEHRNSSETPSNVFSPISLTCASLHSYPCVHAPYHPATTHGSNVDAPSSQRQQQQQQQTQKRDPLSPMPTEQYIMECMASIAYLVGSPLQRCQSTAEEPVQRSMGMVRELLLRGVNPEQIIRVIEAREGMGV